MTPFLDEIAQQPAALRAVVDYYASPGRALPAQWRARAAGGTLFTGMGTSAFAAEGILPALSQAGIAAATADAGELLHYPRRLEGTWLTVISQSGESVEPRRLIDGHPAPFAAITNAPASAIARAAALHLPLCAGAESAISTKTYTNTLAVLHLLAASDLDAALEALAALADVLDAVDTDGIERAADLLAGARMLHCIGRGPGVVAAQQAALTFMEGTRTPATAFTGGSFRHGPFELVEAGHCALLFIAAGATTALLTGLARDLLALGSRVVILTNADLALPAPATVLRVPPTPEALFPLAVAVTQEHLLEALARRHGLVAGAFRYGGKVTTTE